MNYDKKIVKHYAKLNILSQGINKKNPDLLLTADLISAFALYYQNASKPAHNAEKLFDILKPFLLIENFELNDNSDFEKAESVLRALLHYRKITGDNVNDEFLKDLFNKLISSVSVSIKNKDQNFYYALSCADCIFDYCSIFPKEQLNEFFSRLKVALNDCNPVGDNAPCDLFLKCAIGVFKWESKQEKSTAISEDMLETVDFNALSINYAVGKSMLSPQVSSPLATAYALKLATLLYRFSGKEKYKKLLRRIWFNGMQFCQRFSGGVGYDTFANHGEILSVLSYEEDYLTPLYAEGLTLFTKHKELFEEKEGEVVKDSYGRYLIDDKMFARDESEFFGRDLIEIPSLTSFDKETNLQLKLKLNF